MILLEAVGHARSLAPEVTPVLLAHGVTEHGGQAVIAELVAVSQGVIHDVAPVDVVLPLEGRGRGSLRTTHAVFRREGARLLDVDILAILRLPHQFVLGKEVQLRVERRHDTCGLILRAVILSRSDRVEIELAQADLGRGSVSGRIRIQRVVLVVSGDDAR